MSRRSSGPTHEGNRPEPRHLAAYRAAVRLLPRSHRDRFGDEQVTLYSDLAAHGATPWRLWLGLPRDVVAVHARARRRRPALQVADGPQVAPWTPRRAARAALTATAALVHVTWLTAHVVSGVVWQSVLTRAPVVLHGRVTDEAWIHYLGGDAELDRLTGTVDTLVGRLLLTFPLVVLAARWLPGRRWFLAAWVVLWPLGMLLMYGYGSYAAS